MRYVLHTACDPEAARLAALLAGVAIDAELVHPQLHACMTFHATAGQVATYAALYQAALARQGRRRTIVRARRATTIELRDLALPTLAA